MILTGSWVGAGSLRTTFTEMENVICSHFNKSSPIFLPLKNFDNLEMDKLGENVPDSYIKWIKCSSHTSNKFCSLRNVEIHVLL